jgi:membrane-bound serine protease (ClpP class)
MSRSVVRRAVLVTAAAWAAASLTTAAFQAGSAPGAVVYVATVESIIHPVSAEFMMGAIERADREGAALVVFTLRTPGGLVDSTRDIVTRMLAARTPVAVFVGPAGARAASAGFILTIAADVAAMAPGTHIGAAHPVQADGAETDETTAQKAAADLAAYVRTLASGRQRNVPLAEEAVRQSRAFTETEALAASPPLIDLVAADLPELLRQLDGREIRRFDGTMETLQTADAMVVPIDMTMRQRVLSAIANPNVAYLLMSLGMLGLTIELWNPGAILPGVVGGVSLLLAFFALQVLPVNYAGVLLILLGFVFLVLEVFVAGFGLLAAGGLISLVFGSMILMDSPLPELQLNLWAVLPFAIGLGTLMMALVRLAVRAQRQPTVTGAAAMIGGRGRVLTAIAPGTPGRVSTHGEIWSAVSEEPLEEGAHVTVVGVDGLTVKVRRE